MRWKWIFLAPLAVVGILLFIAIGGELVMRLWNWLLPPLFGWHQINFWQAIGLLALCRILFGGFGRHGSGRSNFRRRMAERRETHDAGRTGTIQAGHARSLRLWPFDQREQRAMNQFSCRFGTFKTAAGWSRLGLSVCVRQRDQQQHEADNHEHAEGGVLPVPRF